MARRDPRTLDEALALLDAAERRDQHERQLRIDYTETRISNHGPVQAAVVAAGLMDWTQLRNEPGAVSIYLGALGKGFGPD